MTQEKLHTSPESEHIKEFYAVTATSIYKVEETKTGSAATKIALRGHSKFTVGRDLGNGHHYLIGVGRWLQSYIPEKYGSMHPMAAYERDFEKVSSEWWGAHTSEIVGLFATEQEARDCFKVLGARHADPRWLDSTRTIVKKIGTEHPSFFVSRSRDIGILPNEIL